MAFNRENFIARYKDLRSSEETDSTAQDSEQVDGPLIDMRDGRGVTVTYTLDQLFADPNFTPPRNSLVTGPIRPPYDWEGEIFKDEDEPKPSPAKGLDEESMTVIKRALAAEDVSIHTEEDDATNEVIQHPLPDKPSRRTITSIMLFKERRAAKAAAKQAEAEEAAQKREEVVSWLAPYSKAVKAEAQKPKYSFKVRVRKKLGDAQMWMSEQLSFNGNHSKRNKVILGVGVAATGYLVYKNYIEAPGHKGGSAAVDSNTGTSIGAASRPKTGAANGLSDSIANTPAPTPTPELPVSPPEIVVPQSASITIDSPGQSIWEALSNKGYNDNQILDMIYGLAEKQGVPVESLNYVEVGQSFDVPIA